MKSIKQWLEELPEPYRSQALENTKESNRYEEALSISNALFLAFLWDDSKQKYNYWHDLYSIILKYENTKGSVLGWDFLRNPDVTVKTVNEEAIIKSNREIAEEIWDEVSSLENDGEFSCVDEIEAILNKYIKP